MLTNVSRRRLASEAMNQRVLIIEDEFLIALDVADTIEHMGLKVAGFASARKQALALAPWQISHSSTSISPTAAPAPRSAGNWPRNTA